MKQRKQQTLARRDFLTASAAALSAPYLIPSGVLAAARPPGANDRLTVGHIGVGGMGTGHCTHDQFRTRARSIAAVCDVDESRLAKAVKWLAPGRTLRGLSPHLPPRGHRAVVIATPDHWHAVQTVHACQTGKHVYVEKPSSVTVHEGRAMVRRQGKTARFKSAPRAEPGGAPGTPAGPFATGSSARWTR